MFASSLITDSIPPLKLTDTCGRALIWMDELRVNALPVIDGTTYLGILHKTDILNPELKEIKIKNSDITLSKIAVFENQHVYELTKVATINKLDIVPVINDDNHYIGIVTVNDLVAYFAESKSVYMPGGIIILEMEFKDYSMSHISQIIESDGGHILSASVSATKNQQTIEVTIKIDKVDLSRILAAMYRYNYNVIGSFSQSEFNDDLKSRYDSLMHYLNI
ncbi:MAG: CBS domain-containing protein [Bacteroidota bacterium]